MHLRTFINGILAGIILGVLFAPDSGEETRRKLSRKAQGIKDSYDDFADEVSDTYSNVKDKANSVIGKAKNKMNEMKGDNPSDTMYDV